MMLSDHSVQVVKSTAPVLAARGEELTRHFYRRMFEKNPEVRAFFNPAHQVSGAQQRALAGAICAFASYVDNLEALAPHVVLIAEKHASLGVLPEHYPIVGEHLLASIREVLKEAATDEVVAAWAAAYGALADILIGAEAGIYARHEGEGGWRGFRPFRVARRQRECDRIDSFYLVPEDGAPLPSWRPGQYLTLRVPTEDGATTMRNYSISTAANPEHYRLSVKRELGPKGDGVPGFVSHYLHEQVQVGTVLDVAPPCGEFFLDVDEARGTSRPLVFLAGGVGVTPLLAMVHAACRAELDRDIYFVHGVLHGAAHGFADEIRKLAGERSGLVTHFRYSEAQERDDGCADSHGFVDVPFLREQLPGLDADYYLCGPQPFMAGLFAPLLRAGVPETQIRLEFFGPKGDLLGDSGGQAAQPLAS